MSIVPLVSESVADCFALLLVRVYRCGVIYDPIVQTCVFEV